MHRRIVQHVLESLDSHRAGYFFDVVSKLEEDPRTGRFPNFVYLLLKETMSLLPAYLDKNEFLDMLFAFVERNQWKMRKHMFGPEFIYNPAVLKQVTNDFVTEVVERTLEHYEEGAIDTGEPSVIRLTWPYSDEDLKALEGDDFDDDET